MGFKVLRRRRPLPLPASGVLGLLLILIASLCRSPRASSSHMPPATSVGVQITTRLIRRPLCRSTSVQAQISTPPMDHVTIHYTLQTIACQVRQAAESGETIFRARVFGMKKEVSLRFRQAAEPLQPKTHRTAPHRTAQHPAAPSLQPPHEHTHTQQSKLKVDVTHGQPGQPRLPLAGQLFPWTFIIVHADL